MDWTNRKDCHTDYMKGLKDIACAGLGAPKEPHESNVTHVTIADRALDTLCWDVLTRWGQDARSRSIKSYGIALLAFQLGIVLVLFLIGWTGIPEKPELLKAYGAALTGTSVGAWLIFVLRSLREDWASLVAAASDTVKPWIRAAYVILFAFIAVLILQTSMVTFTVGQLKSEVAFSPDKPELFSALLFGFFLGLADLTLPTVISQRAQEVAGRLGTAARLSQ
jgi:hypothetical protein